MASFITEFLNDAFRQYFVYLRMPWNRLRNPGLRILKPIMLGAMPDENRAQFLDLFDQVTTLHAISSSAWRRTLGIAPEVKSWYKSARCAFRSSKLVPWVK